MAKTNVTYINRLDHITRDKGYRFAERDPAMIEVCNLITASGKSIGDVLEEVLNKSNNTVHISYATVANWLSGKTKKPQNYILNWVLLALGYERKITKIKLRR